jgi:hypothetical protein
VSFAKEHQIELQRKSVEIPINQAIELDSEDDEWLEISIRDRLILEAKRPVKTTNKQAVDQQSVDDFIQLLIEFKASEPPQSSSKVELFKKVVVSDSHVEYSPLSESSSSSPQLESFGKRPLKRGRSDVGSSRPQKETVDSESLKGALTQMNLADRIEEMKKRHQSKRNVASADVDQANIVEGKRVKFVSSKYSKSDYAQLAWTEEEWGKIPEFHVAFMVGLMKNQTDVQIGLKDETSISANRIHISTLLSSSAHWRAMLKHPHGDGFRKATQLEFDAIEGRGTWEIVNKSSIPENQKIISLKWVFIYKNDSDGYLTKYKARIVVRGDLQDADSQDVYAATLASKVFRVLMALVIAFHLETRQLDVVNAFLNAHNDEPVYCQMPDDYRLDGKCYRVIRALYGQRKSPLLWLRILTTKCLELGLKLISGEPCLFISGDGIIMFFYVDDIVFAYRTDRKRAAESYIARLKSMFEMRDMESVKFFLGVRVIQIGSIYLVQDTYIDKLVKDYKINTNSKASSISLSIGGIESFDEDVDLNRMHEYRKKVGSVCYSAVISRPDIVKTVSKLAEYLINPESAHIAAVNHLIRYLYETKHLAIKFDVSGGEELTAKNVFEAIADAAFANEKGRKSVEGYIFKLFGGLIDWAAKKQATVSTSTTEAELLAMLHAGKEFI